MTNALDLQGLSAGVVACGQHGHPGSRPLLPQGVGRLRVAGIDVAGHKLSIDIDADRCEISGAGPLTINTAPRPR